MAELIQISHSLEFLISREGTWVSSSKICMSRCQEVIVRYQDVDVCGLSNEMEMDLGLSTL